MAAKDTRKTAMDRGGDLTRSVAAALVDREERRVGSRMVAYEIVAQSVGTTSAWLRSFLSTNGAKEPRFSVGLNLIEAYRRVCERVELAGDRERQRKEQIYAALKSAGLLVAPAKGTEGSGAQASDADGDQSGMEWTP